MILVSGPIQLAAFRQKWDGQAMLDLVAQNNGRLRVDWAIGIGKSHNIDLTIEAAVKTNKYDLAIAFFPTRQIINERKWIKNPPAKVRIINLKPRPSIKCGAVLNRAWKAFEKNGLGAFGRVELCGQCPHQNMCPWPRQYGKALAGAQVIFGTQSHLERSPNFIEQLSVWTGAKRILIILDEASFIMKPFQRRITGKKLEVFADVLKRMNSKRWGRMNKRWLYLTELLITCSTEDLRCYEWWMPRFLFDWAVAVQKYGFNAHGNAFYFIPYDLVHFSKSPLESRERSPENDVVFASPPAVRGDFIIYSGTANHEFSKHRLGSEFSSPFDNYRFEHPGTTWYNIASRLGMKTYFLKNSPQILDFFACLVAERLKEGKHPLLVAKKCFIPFCAAQIEKRLLSMGTRVQVLCNDWRSILTSNKVIVPLINFGMIGTNSFNRFDCAYCLTGFYVNDEVVNGILQDTSATDLRVPINISVKGTPLRRHAGVLNARDRLYDVNKLSQYALDHHEMGTVLQAVGRVRPYTEPREVITFQCARHPDISYTKEFSSIKTAREYFGVQSYRSRRVAAARANIQAVKAQGANQTRAAAALGVSLRTVKRYWN